MNSAGAVAIIASSLIAIPRFVSIAAAVFAMAIATLMTMATHTTPPATPGATIAKFTAFNPRSPQSILSDAGRESGVGEGKEFEMSKESWQWWAGRSEEWMDLGSYQTRDDAIAGGLSNIGEGEGDFVVMEACSLIPPPLDADTIINDYFEHLGDSSDYYSGEGDYPEWLLPVDQQKVAEAELQQLLTAWSEKWLINNMNDPDQFGETRNVETIINTVDPDMLPGGHDNPVEAS